MKHVTALIVLIAQAGIQGVCRFESHWSPELARVTHCALSSLLALIIPA